MSDDPIARLGAHQAAGIAILNNELKAVHDDASEASAIEREKSWVAELEAVALPFGPAFVSLLVPHIGEIEEDELRLIAEYLEDENGHIEAEPRSVDHALALVTLAVRLHRIQRKLKQLDAGTASVDVAPIKKRRGRPPKGKPWANRAEDWAAEMRFRPNRPKAEEIARREGIEPSSVERAARDVRQKRRKADKR